MTARRAIPFSACAALLLAAPPFLPPYALTLLTQILIYAIFAMSLDLLLGYTRLASLGHAAYFGVAAYVVAILTTRYHASLRLCLCAALLAASAVAAVFGLIRSEEHTSELQSLRHLVCRLLLEKKKKQKNLLTTYNHNT